MINLKITTPSGGDDTAGKGQLVLLFPIQVDVVACQCLGAEMHSRPGGRRISVEGSEICGRCDDHDFLFVDVGPQSCSKAGREA